MRILLATYHLRNWTGSELFAADLARSLAARGHEVYLHSPRVGALAQRLADEGFKVTPHLADFAALAFDVAHVQHNVVAAAVRAFFPHLPMVLMLHGVLPEPEQPPSADLGIARFLCVSEEVQQHAQRKGTFGATAEVVRNFVNPQYWCPATPVNPELRRVLALTNDYPPVMQSTVEAACVLAGVRMERVGAPENSQTDVRPYIARADLVITLGRGAIEAMVMGRNVVVMGSQGGDGFVDEESFFNFRKRNFSGRSMGINFSAETLAHELSRYDHRLGRSLRNLVIAENAESKIVGRLESIYQEAARQKVKPLADSPLPREFAFLYQEVCHSYSPEAELASVYASKSWRWTVLLRWILSLLCRSPILGRIISSEPSTAAHPAIRVRSGPSHP